MSKATIPYSYEDHNDTEAECTIEVHTWPYYRAAVLHGPPDNWCPEEGEAAEYELLDLGGIPIDDNTIDRLDDDIQQVIIDHLEQLSESF